MLTLNLIREKREYIVERLRIKNFDAEEITRKIYEVDLKRRDTQLKADNLLSEMNRLSREIGTLFAEGKSNEANDARKKTGEIKEEIRELTNLKGELEKEVNELLVQLPNLPHESVSPGKGENDNVKVKEGGLKPSLSGSPLPHWDLMKKYDIIDLELGNKLTGAGFPVYKGKGAKLQRALINFFLDEGEKAGFREILPPIVVNEDSGFGTGQLPDKEGQMYHVQADNF